MSPAGFEVLSDEPVRLDGPDALLRCKLMSPYVWGEAPDQLSMLVRAVPEDGATTGTIWYAAGGGLAFRADPGPVLVPGPDALDAFGCEDPTVVPIDDGCLIYYTGILADGTAQLLYAEGHGIHALAKRGIAHASTAADRNTKEAAVERLDGRWLLLFEYSRDGLSRMGRAEADGPAGPWTEQPDPMLARPGRWDGWHLSTGPLLIGEAEGPLMFYNGADPAGNWAIGWVRFDERCTHVVARCDEPLIALPARAGADGRRIAFAASAVSDGETIALYYSENDASLRRAMLRRAPA